MRQGLVLQITNLTGLDTGRNGMQGPLGLTKAVDLRKDPRKENGSSKEGTEELLLPEGVLRSGHRGDEGILTGVSITVSHQVCCCLGYLYPAQAGFNL